MSATTTFYCSISSVLEFATPYFTPIMTIKQSSDIEGIQKIVMKVILGRRYQLYDQACKLLDVSSLQNRRKHLSLNFALACLKSPQHSNLFVQRKSMYYKLRNIKSFEVPFCHTKRYSCSPIPYLTSLLNEHFEKKKTRNNNEL